MGKIQSREYGLECDDRDYEDLAKALNKMSIIHQEREGDYQHVFMMHRDVAVYLRGEGLKFIRVEWTGRSEPRFVKRIVKRLDGKLMFSHKDVGTDGEKSAIGMTLGRTRAEYATRRKNDNL